MGIKRIFAEKKLRRLAKQRTHNAVLPEFDQLKTVGVLWTPSQKNAFLYLKEQFNKEHLIFRSFCLFEEDVNPQEGSNTLTTADLDWLGFPKKEKVQDFTSIHFDLLLCLADQDVLARDYILLKSKANFITGSALSDTNYFDLNIKSGENRDPIYLAKQQIFYLAQLNKKSSK